MAPVLVAVPDNVCKKFSALRSAVSRARARPEISHSVCPGRMLSPSRTRQLIVQSDQVPESNH